MKKYMVACAGLCVALAFTSCKSSESAYRKMYEKAKAQEENRATEQTKNYSVVVGSFSVQANAEGVQSTLKSQGYDAQVAYNSSNQMYRVVAATFDSKPDAVRSRNELRSQYPDAWLLYSQK